MEKVYLKRAAGSENIRIARGRGRWNSLEEVIVEDCAVVEKSIVRKMLEILYTFVNSNKLRQFFYFFKFIYKLFAVDKASTVLN